MVMKRQDILLEPSISGVPVDPEQGGRKMVEIGFGNGEFLSHLAGLNPDTTVYGLEISMTCVGKAVKRAIRENLGNVRIICGDARFLLRECFGDESLDRIYMSFPCPWPKERHARRRVTHRGFSDVVASVLRIGGCFELATDEKWYADEVASILDSHPSLSLISFEVNKRREITTKYERKWLEQGKDIYLLVFEKIGNFTVDRIVDGRCDDMHVAVKSDELDMTVLRNERLGISEGEDGAHWTLERIYSDSRDSWLIQAVTSDDGYEQKFYVRVVLRENGALVKVDGICSPYLTPAVRKALEAVAGSIRRS